MSSILLATDGSPSAERATDEAVRLARATGWPLHVVVVWKTPVIVGYGYTPMAPVHELSEAEQQAAHEVAERVAARGRAAGAETSFEVREGDAADEICAAAGEIRPELIVIGSHGWGGFRRTVLGSVSNRVVHEAPCGVLVVRTIAE
ncbi:MAG: universal stress protein [Actinomycetota bacterium]